MSNKKRKTDYFILCALAALTIGVLLIFVFLGWMKQGHPGLQGIRSTYSTNVDATIVYYTLLEKLGISVGRSEEILLSEVLGETDVLFLLDPVTPIYPDEIKDIQTWLTTGGVLICTKENLRPGVNIVKTLSRDYRRISRRYPKFERPKATLIPIEQKSLPLAQDISKIHFKTSNVYNTNVFDPNHPRSFCEPLLIDSCGGRIAVHKLGRGCIITLSDSSFLANGQIGKGDNSVLAVNLVSYGLSKARGDRVVFDEYHLDYRYHETGFSVLSRALFTTPAGWSVLSLTVAGVLFMIYKGRRFGIRRGLVSSDRRSKLEYIYAVGSTYRSAGANRLTLELILAWLKHKVTNNAGLARNASNKTIAFELSRRSGTESQKYEEVLDRCDRLIAQDRLSERYLLLAIKQLTRIELEVFNEYRNRKGYSPKNSD